jgi:hypothetical protein
VSVGQPIPSVGRQADELMREGRGLDRDRDASPRPEAYRGTPVPGTLARQP